MAGDCGGASQENAEYSQHQSPGPVPPHKDGQCGGGGGRSRKRRHWAAREEERMRRERAAQWIGRVRGRNIVRRGQFLLE